MKAIWTIYYWRRSEHPAPKRRMAGKRTRDDMSGMQKCFDYVSEELRGCRRLVFTKLKLYGTKIGKDDGR